ncbi:MAG TPA: radical SAM protein [Candidatus Limnocylindrales bacterium]|nr:radical SAM protein [Candidatus Limnocylindrales bacterium]
MNWKLKKKYQALLSKERSMPFKDSMGSSLTLALAYPNTYYVGMSNLGFQTIYKYLNLRPDTRCERVFLPDPEDEDIYLRQNIPLLTLESQRLVTDVDILAFSVSFENDYVNLLKILELARIPFKSVDRDERYPLILIGGAITYINPEPLADFADLMIIGDGEEVLEEYLSLFLEDGGIPRKKHLERAAQIPGVYVPSLTSSRITIEKQKVSDFKLYPAYSAIITDETEFSEMFLIEVSRGCPLLCRFCAVSYVYPKFRMLPPDFVIDIIRERLRMDAERGFPPIQKVGLVSSDICDYRGLDTLCQGLRELGVKVSVSSFRIDRLPDVLLDAIAYSGIQTLAIAPEAGSERLRRVIRKEMTDEEVIEGAERILDRGVPNLKLYFMIGLPTETDEDLDSLIEITLKIRQKMLEKAKTTGKLGKLSLSINPFIPKPLTPFQWSPMVSMKEVKRKLEYIRKRLGQVRNVELKPESLRTAYLEGILSRGDRSMGQFLIAIHACRGNWERAAKEIGLNWEACLAGRSNLSSTPLPWEFISNPREQERLAREYQRSQAVS